MSEPDPPFDLFVLHAPDADAWVRGELLPALERAGLTTRTAENLRLGEFRPAAYEDLIRGARRVLLVASPGLAGQRELLAAQYMAQAESWVESAANLLVVQLDGAAVPPGLGGKVNLDVPTDAMRPGTVARLLRELGRKPSPAPAPPECPYPGLLPYTEDQARLFCGRDTLVRRLFDRWLVRPELFLIGPSGSGKTSLVRAGLIPKLRSAGWDVATLRPGRRPAEAWTALGPTPGKRSAVFVDQFEEAFHQADANQFQAFELILLDWVGAGNGLVSAMRADYYGDLMKAQSLWARFGPPHCPVPPPDVAGLREAIEGPARAAGVEPDPRLADGLIADADPVRQPGVLPHVQTALRLAWDGVRERYFPLSAYRVLGDERQTGLQRAMALLADDALRELTDEEQNLAMRVLLRLVEFVEGRPPVRRRQPVAELRSLGDPPGALERVLTALVGGRLVVTGQEAEQPVADLAHEALITGWPRFEDWVGKRRDQERQRRHLAELVRAWVHHGRRPNAALLDAIELVDAEDFAQKGVAFGVGVPDGLKELIAASRAALAAVEWARQEQVAALEREREVARRQAETENTFAAGLWLLLGRQDGPLDASETSALTDLGRLSKGQVRARIKFIEEGLANSANSQRFVRRWRVAVQAAVGLNRALIVEVRRVVQRRLAEEAVSPEVRAAAALALVVVLPVDQSTLGAAGGALLDALNKATTAAEIGDLTVALLAVTKGLPEGQKADLLDQAAKAPARCP
jgi:hypothetical protein